MRPQSIEFLRYLLQNQRNPVVDLRHASSAPVSTPGPEWSPTDLGGVREDDTACYDYVVLSCFPG